MLHPKSSLGDMLTDLLGETPDVKENAGVFLRNGVVFAARLGSNAIELRLGHDIAEAAMSTPHTGSSARGDDWVRLETNDWSAAHDRLEAWYRVAWRLAAKRR